MYLIASIKSMMYNNYVLRVMCTLFSYPHKITNKLGAYSFRKWITITIVNLNIMKNNKYIIINDFKIC